MALTRPLRRESLRPALLARHWRAIVRRADAAVRVLDLRSATARPSVEASFERTSWTSIASSRTAIPRMTPTSSVWQTRPARTKVKKTATITAAAAKMTRPECARPPIVASRGSWERS